MTRREKAALNEDAVAFVHRVITKVYGQNPRKSTVSATAKRVVATLPTAPYTPTKAGSAHVDGHANYSA